MNAREERIGLNESLFRTVNERLKTVNEAFDPLLQTAEFVCECGDDSCMERITMTLAEYERLRSDAATFAIVPGHVAASVERVVSTSGDHEIIRKNPGEPTELAAKTQHR